MTPREQLAAIRKRAVELYEEAQQCLSRKLLPKLDKAGIHVLELRPFEQEPKRKRRMLISRRWSIRC